MAPQPPSNLHGRRSTAVRPERADVVLAGLAARQHGRVAVWQLLDLGITPTEIRGRVAAGRLHREHQGVYAVGHPGGGDDARSMSAVLAGGPGCLLSHRSAVHHLRLLPGPGPERVHVTAVGRTRDGHPQIALHLPRHLSREAATTVRGVPCTTAARSLADFAAEATDTELATAVHVATTRTLCSAGQLEVQFRRRIAGIGRLRRLVEPVGPDLRGALEEAFAAFVRRGGWPPYEANVLLQTPLGPLRGDAVWRQYGFGVELDSWRYHGGRDAFESDRERVVAADLIGLDLRRVTWRMLHARPEVVAALLDRHVGRGRGVRLGRSLESSGPGRSTERP